MRNVWLPAVAAMRAATAAAFPARQPPLQAAAAAAAIAAASALAQAAGARLPAVSGRAATVTGSCGPRGEWAAQ
eukprot:CAMPEP_0171246380 /NCGR_PEP_ID=MMETSP0790-20130122/47918_1 /TAXON_ID=2925 /ORGANISM="Alexandrium catenella, Strain OF101" /LENGTH=73 /DNA_ID=CAMNT_0011713693 /DNA_START=67 /DNA_END=285 /DNA_ORIENTATION=-